ncbi:NAD-dependent epimerase/dehydratase family protein [Paucihalobacter sp.]|uniref:NAD-dependent epimerase/dehydratase family protein n=1 Tax=Paucihalobacter sp. TaxID=2850405 RepID=UPI002FE1B992
MTERILIIGAAGQIGSELCIELRSLYGTENVIASDINLLNEDLVKAGPFEIIDAKNFDQIKDCVEKHHIDTVYLLAAMLSATAERLPQQAWDLNIDSLFHVLNLAKDGIIKKVFWPSSIAVFGPSTPKINTPQNSIMEPTTVYGISKQAGERWCEYYHKRYNVDVRSLRYPGIISYKTSPGGGTTDYAIDIFHKAISDNHYNCFLEADCTLPMMYMDDAVAAAIQLMKADGEKLRIRSSYNLSAVSFSPSQLAAVISKHIPNFSIDYNPDFRQRIAESWPDSIDDTVARKDWGWQHAYDLETIATLMLNGISKMYNNQQTF